MSTRSRIGYVVDGSMEGEKPSLLQPGVIKSVYCHWDGYLEYNGAILRDYYKTYKDVVALVSLGSLSSLGKSLEYEDMNENGTRDYHRWRNEPICIETDYGIDDYLNCGFDSCEEFLYLFKDNEWWYATWDQPQLRRLNNVILEGR